MAKSGKNKRTENQGMEDYIVPRYLPERFGSLVQEHRTRRGLSQDEVAYLAGITRIQVGRIERGECNPTVATMERLAKVLDIPREKIMKSIGAEEENVEVRAKVGAVFQELAQKIVRRLSDPELETMCKIIKSFTDQIK